MFKIGDVVEYIGDFESQLIGDKLLLDWMPPNQRDGFYIVESIRLANEDDCQLRRGVEVYKLYVRGTVRLTGSHNYAQILHVTDMFWDFELRNV